MFTLIYSVFMVSSQSYGLIWLNPSRYISQPFSRKSLAFQVTAICWDQSVGSVIRTVCCPKGAFNLSELGPVSRVPKLFGPILSAAITFISSRRRGSKPSNFTILSVFLTSKTYLRISFSKQAGCSLTTGYSGPKRFHCRYCRFRLNPLMQRSLRRRLDDIPAI